MRLEEGTSLAAGGSASAGNSGTTASSSSPSSSSRRAAGAGRHLVLLPPLRRRPGRRNIWKQEDEDEEPSSAASSSSAAAAVSSPQQDRHGNRLNRHCRYARRNTRSPSPIHRRGKIPYRLSFVAPASDFAGEEGAAGTARCCRSDGPGGSGSSSTASSTSASSTASAAAAPPLQTPASVLKVRSQGQSLSRTYSSSLSTSSTSDANSNGTAERKDAATSASVVSFGDVTVHRHAIVLGDNPSCSAGPPLSIDWLPLESIRHATVDEHNRTCLRRLIDGEEEQRREEIGKAPKRRQRRNRKKEGAARNEKKKQQRCGRRVRRVGTELKMGQVRREEILKSLGYTRDDFEAALREVRAIQRSRDLNARGFSNGNSSFGDGSSPSPGTTTTTTKAAQRVSAGKVPPFLSFLVAMKAKKRTS